MESSQVYNELNRHWKSVCRILFSQELGELDDFKVFQERYSEKLHYSTSEISGKKVVFSLPYSKGSRFISGDEQLRLNDSKPLEIDSIKDIDSLLLAVKEKVVYSGNKVLGNSGNLLECESITDSFYAYRSFEIISSEYMAYSLKCRECKDLFGCCDCGEAHFSINGSMIHRTTRSFELGMCANSSDSYLSYGLDNCHDCMFSFNLRSKKFAIGNNELGREKYTRLKEGLVSQIAEELREKKTFPSLIELSR